MGLDSEVVSAQLKGGRRPDEEEAVERSSDSALRWIHDGDGCEQERSGGALF
jgi:hypothetical protein